MINWLAGILLYLNPDVSQLNDMESPYFETDFKHTQIAVVGTFDELTTKLHVDSFLNLYEFGETEGDIYLFVTC